MLFLGSLLRLDRRRAHVPLPYDEEALWNRAQYRVAESQARRLDGSVSLVPVARRQSSHELEERRGAYEVSLVHYFLSQLKLTRTQVSLSHCL